MQERLVNFFSNLQTSLPDLLSKRNIAGLLVLGITVLSIPIGVELVKNQQTLKSQAANSPTSCEAFKLSNPKITNTCATCLAKQRPGLVEAIKQSHSYAAQCDNQALMHLWCNGGSQTHYCTGNNDVFGCTQGKDSYNTSPAATRACVDTMSGVCFEECKETIYDKSFGTCSAVVENFPQQPLDPYKTYEFNICETRADNNVPQEHVSLRRDSALMGVINATLGAGQCGGASSRWGLDSGGPGLHSLQFAKGDTSLYEHPPGGQPLGQSNKPSSHDNNTPRYTPRTVCTDYVYEVKGKEGLLPEGQNKIGYNSCAYNLGGQSQDVGTECALCLESKKPGISGEVQNLNYGLFRACSVRELLNKWCSTIPGDGINPIACSELKTQCGQVCGVNPTATPTPGGSATSTPSTSITPSLTPTPVPVSLPQNLHSFCLLNNVARVNWSRVPGAVRYELTVIDHLANTQDLRHVLFTSDPDNIYVRPFMDFATSSGMTHSWSVKAIDGGGTKTSAAVGLNFGCN